MKIAVIGAGNGGQALAGYLASIGNEVIVSELNQTIVDVLRTKAASNSKVKSTHTANSPE